MATRQLLSYINNQPEAVENGVNVTVIRISVSTTVSPTDTWQIGKLPVNAIPTDAIFYLGTAGQVNLQLGISASPSLFFASATYSITVNRAANRLGLAAQASLSDDKMPRFVNVTMSAAGGTGATLGYLGELVLYYKMPGQTL